MAACHLIVCNVSLAVSRLDCLSIAHVKVQNWLRSLWAGSSAGLAVEGGRRAGNRKREKAFYLTSRVHSDCLPLRCLLLALVWKMGLADLFYRALCCFKCASYGDCLFDVPSSWNSKCDRVPVL